VGGHGSRCFEENVRDICRIRSAIPEIATENFIRPPLQDFATRSRCSMDVELARPAEVFPALFI